MDISFSDYSNSYNDLPYLMQMGPVNLYTYTNKMVDQHKTQVLIQPISSTLYNGTTIHFRLKTNIDRIKSAYLRIAYTNVSRSNFICSNPQSWIASTKAFSINGRTLPYSTNENKVAILLIVYTRIGMNLIIPII